MTNAPVTVSGPPLRHITPPQDTTSSTKSENLPTRAKQGSGRYRENVSNVYSKTLFLRTSRYQNSVLKFFEETSVLVFCGQTSIKIAQPPLYVNFMPSNLQVFYNVRNVNIINYQVLYLYFVFIFRNKKFVYIITKLMFNTSFFNLRPSRCK